MESIVTIAAHIVLALVLFRLVNLVGEHATDFGYASTTLFEEPNESLALNFFIRALSPAVFIVALSAATVAAGYPTLRLGIFWIAIYYYAIRVLYIFVMNMQQLVSWSRLLIHSSVGLTASWFAYEALIIPNRSLLPNFDTIGNELWLAIFAFLYAVSNKVTVAGGPGHKRRNAYIRQNYRDLVTSFDPIITAKAFDDALRLVAYSILVYEGYARPPSIRIVERLCFWKKERTTGIMQVSSHAALTDEESVVLGLEKLSASWLEHSEEAPYHRIRRTVIDYNRDENYVNRVFEVMAILALRTDPSLRKAYDSIWSE